MTWKECSSMSQRLDFVELAQVERTNVALLCRRFGISRKTGYKWLRRYQVSGQAGLADHSRRPKATPKRTPAAVESQVVELRQKHRTWGGRKLKARLCHLGMTCVPSASTITEILRRHELLDAKRCQENQTPMRFEYPNP